MTPSGGDGRRIRLNKFGEAWGIADGSPFCLKLENFLREADIPFDVEPFNFRRSFRRAPKGKLPFIEDTDGTLIGDSSLIIALLSQRHGIDLDAPLTPGQTATAHACRRMLDEHLYWVIVHSRWLDEAGWPVTRQAFFSRMPALLQPVATALARRGVTSALHAQGIGRHPRETIYALGQQDVEALSRLLGDDSYFFATERPTLLDLWAHAFIAEIIAPPIPSPLQSATRALDNLVAHCQRLQTRLYGRPIAAAGE